MAGTSTFCWMMTLKLTSRSKLTQTGISRGPIAGATRLGGIFRRPMAGTTTLRGIFRRPIAEATTF